MITRFVKIFLAGTFCLGVLISCMGIGSEITIGRDGSGTIKLEYRLSRELESLGKLDGNARRPPVPVGKSDFERTVARIPGLTLKSFDSSAAGNDLVYRIALDFADTASLIRFLDATGQGASFVRENNQNLLSLQIGGGQDLVNPDLRELTASISEGYSLDLSFSLPSRAELSLADGTGRPLSVPPLWRLTGGGSRVSFSAPIGDLLLFDSPVRLEIRWGL
jgi:hypothetical protein